MYTCFPHVPEVHGSTTELHEKSHVHMHQWICLEQHQGCATGGYGRLFSENANEI